MLTPGLKRGGQPRLYFDSKCYLWKRYKRHLPVVNVFFSFSFYVTFTNRLISCEREVIMHHRGHHRPEPGHNSHRSKDREEQRRYHQQMVREQIPPSLSSRDRDRDRHWVYPEASYRTHFTSPLPRPENYPYYAQQYHYGYPEHHRPESRCVRYGND